MASEEPAHRRIDEADRALPCRDACVVDRRKEGGDDRRGRRSTVYRQPDVVYCHRVAHATSYGSVSIHCGQRIGEDSIPIRGEVGVPTTRGVEDGRGVRGRVVCQVVLHSGLLVAGRRKDVREATARGQFGRHVAGCLDACLDK